MTEEKRPGHALRPTPPQPVFYGQMHFGAFQEPFRTINLVEADVFGHRWAPRWWRNLRLKEWQRITVFTPEITCDLALCDAKIMAASVCTIHDRETGQIIAHHRTSRARGAIQVAGQLWRGESFFRTPGYRLRFQHQLNRGQHHVQVMIDGQGHTPPVRADLTLHEDLTASQPMIAVLPLNDHRRPLYAHHAICPVEGKLQAGDHTWTLTTGRDRAMFEAQKAFLPRRASWQQLVVTGLDQDGATVAVHLVRNMIEDDTTWNTCGAWVNGALHRLGAARFGPDPGATGQPAVSTATGESARFMFTPETKTNDRFNLVGLVRADCQRIYGTATGFFLDTTGQRHEISQAPGLIGQFSLKA